MGRFERPRGTSRPGRSRYPFEIQTGQERTAVAALNSERDCIGQATDTRRPERATERLQLEDEIFQPFCQWAE